MTASPLTDGERPLRSAILIGWGLASVVLTLAMSRDIAFLWFPDPDDAMRLNEVRDWLSGQSWWDVDQHRLWGGAFHMHWSRLVDLPLAAVIGPLDPLIGPEAATRAAMIVVPLITLLVVVAIAASITRRVAGTAVAQTAILLTPLSVPLIYQIRPMRIDHHGWQVGLALVAVAALLRRPDWRSGTLLGVSLATLLTVSLEGLPIAATILGVAGLAWAFDPERRGQLVAASIALVSGATMLQLATRGPHFWSAACDAMAPSWLAIFAVSATTLVAGIAIANRRGVGWRFGALLVAGGAALATLMSTAPACALGPFSSLDPIVRTFWYDKISEGLPIWDQAPAWAAMAVGFPVFGLIGAVLAVRAASPCDRANWIMLLAISTLGFAVSLLVMRAGATANALALPGGAWALNALLVRARAIAPVLPRAAATAGSLALATPGLMTCAIIGWPVGAAISMPDSMAAVVRPPCTRGHEVQDLAALPPSLLFAPLDVSPEILATTRHRAVGSGYHRNQAAIRAVLLTFMAEPVAAERMVRASGAAYVVGCPGVNETGTYRHVAPDGFWARLERGERFDWLQPVTIPGSPVLVWRVLPVRRNGLREGRLRQ